MKPSQQLLTVALLLVCLCTPASAFSMKRLLQDNNPWKAYILSQQGNLGANNNRANNNRVRPRDITYLPLSEGSAKMKMFVTYDRVTGKITKVKGDGDYQFCANTAGETQCAANSACTGFFATENPCSVYGGLGPCGVSMKGGKAGFNPAGGFTIRVDMRANAVGSCPRRRAASRRLLQEQPMIMTTQLLTTHNTVNNTDDEMEPDQTVTFDGPDPTELKPPADDDEEDNNMPTNTPVVTTTRPTVMPVAMPTQPVIVPTQPVAMPTNAPVVTTTAPNLTPQNPVITSTPNTGSQDDGMEPDQQTNYDEEDPNVTQDNQDNMDDEDTSMDTSDDNYEENYDGTYDDNNDGQDVTVTNTNGGMDGGYGGGRGGGGRGGGQGSKNVLKFNGGVCEVATLIQNGSNSECACFVGFTRVRVGRRAPRMASGNGGNDRAVYKRWKCKNLQPKTGSACICNA